MELKEINQIVKVGAVFKGSAITPKWFTWEERKYQIKEVNYNWRDRQGSEDIHCFSVTDGTNNYELAFNAKRLTWTLNKICGSL